MVTGKLHEGQIVSNYNEMCALLGQEVKSGASKRSQTKDWQRYFLYEQKGHKYIVKNIYEEPLQKVDNTIYIRLIECLLANELSTQPNYTDQYTKTNLFHILGMVNDFYITKKYDVLTDIPKWQINNFFQRSSNKLSAILFSALHSMEKRCLLKYFKLYTIVEVGHVSGQIEKRIADYDEHQEILRVERNVLKEMGLKEKPYFAMNEFYSRVNTKLNGMFGWKSVYSEIKLIYNKDQMQDALAEIKDDLDFELKKRKLTLNSNIVEAINTQAEKYLSKNREKYKRLFFENVENGWVDECMYDEDNRIGFEGFSDYPNDYVQNQKELAELFINIR